MTTYYVSSLIGSNTNAGTSSTTPLASLQAAANLVKPGDTVEVMNGTYTGPLYGDLVDITTSGTASAPITFEAAPGQTPVIDSSGCWSGIHVEASYINIEGFTVVGDAASYNLASATAGYSCGSSQLDGNGITVTSTTAVPLPNHVTIENNTVYDEGGGGIDTGGADYVQILNNVVYNNGNWSAYGCSGISVTTSQNLDTAAGAHIVISGNISYDNAQLVPTNGAGVVEDGEGIILDTNPNYTSEILVTNNTVFGNGSSGIESFLTNGAVITGNTVYGNDTQNVQPASDAQIIVNQSTNDTVTNNNTSSPSVAAPVISQGVLNANDSITLTGTAIAGATVTVTDGGTSALGTTVAGSNGSWSFTTQILAAGAHALTATDTTSVGTSAASNTFSATALSNAANTQAPAAPVISSIVENADDSLTLTGTAVANSTLKIQCCGGALATTVVNSAGAWSYTSLPFGTGVYGFTATDTTPGGTSAASVAVGLTVVSEPASAAPAAPVISNGVVNANDSVTLTGTAPAGATVAVLDGPTSSYEIGTTTASSTGAWSFTTADLPTGAWAFSTTDTTSAGASAASNVLGVNVQDAAPAAPVISAAVVNSNDTVTLTGTAVANATVVLACNGGAAGITTASNTGAWSFTTAALTAASYAFTATDTTALATSAPSSVFDLTVGGAAPVAPAAPVISTGAANANGSVTLTGTAVAGATVTVSDGGSSALGTTTASSTGAWTFTTTGLTAATYAFTATDTTSAGTSAACSAFNVKVAAASISAPVISTGVANANGSVTLTGTAVDNATVTVSDGGSSALGTATASATGAWSFTTADLAAATYAFTATDTTSAGTSAASSALDVTVPTAASVSAPVISSVVANANDSVTVTGTATANAAITVWNTVGSEYGTATASSTGAWSYTTGTMLPGVYGFEATATTSAGTSGDSNAIGITLSAAPAAPVISTGVVNSNDSVTLTGTAVGGATVTVSDGGASALGTTTASSTGAWTFTTADLSSAAYAFTATDTTSAGTSASSSPRNVTVLPTAPVIKTGAVNASGSVTLTGTAVSGATVTVSDGGASALGAATANSAGAWSFTTPVLTAAAYAFTATDTTSVGTSAASSAFNLTMLPAPVLSTGVANANGSVTLTGAATAGVTVTVWNGGSSALGTTKASSTGAWTFTTSGLKAGAYTFTATDPTATAASPASSPLSVTVPLPAAPVIGNEVENYNDTVTLTGTAVASSKVNLSCNGGAIGTASVNSAGAWSFTTGLLNPAPYGFTATDTTSAGTSAASAALGLTVVVAAPVIKGYTANANGSITLTGNAANGSTVTVSDGGSKPLGTATAGSSGAWSFTTAGLPAATYKFTATDTISSGTSGTSNAYYVKNPLPAAPAITTSQVNSDDSITMAGTGVAGSTLTVWSTSGTKIGTTTVSSSGTWNEGIGAQSAGVYGYEATDTTAAGTSGDSNVISLTIPSASVALASAISSAAASSSTSVASTTTANSNALALVSASALHAAAA